MTERGYNHNSPLPSDVEGSTDQAEYVDPVETQVMLLRDKGCGCRLD
jgi:hypothetical protein